MEILGEIVFALFGGVIEFIFEIVFQIIAELFGMAFGKKSEADEQPGYRPWLSAAAYIAGGLLCGAISLWLAPALWLPAGWQRWVNLIATPVIAGIILHAWDDFRADPRRPSPALPGFHRGFLFAAAMAGVRMIWGR